MTDPEHELLQRHLVQLHELIRGISTRLHRIEACLGLMKETGRLAPLGQPWAGAERRGGGEAADDA